MSELKLTVQSDQRAVTFCPVSADLSQADLHGANLRGTNLSGTDFIR